MAKIKASLIITVLNEESSIEHLLSSILIQTKKPDEVIIVDGGSTDKTVEIINSFKPLITKLQVYVEKGANRSVGRNFAIKNTSNEFIGICDSGCILDKNWFKEIIKPFSDTKTKVVAGYYQARSESIFQKCVVPYVLVMPDKINPKKFLPASRSMAIKKTVWEKSGGFPEDYSDNEDYVYANRLKNKKIKMTFAPQAIVYWFPRNTLKQFWIMIYRFARGDARAGLRTIKVLSIFLRYVILLFFGLACFVFHSLVLYLVIMVLFYFWWSITKNYRYINDARALYILPVLQIASDLAIIFGSIAGGLSA